MSVCPLGTGKVLLTFPFFYGIIDIEYTIERN